MALLFKENEPRVHERPDKNPIQQWSSAMPPVPNQDLQARQFQQQPQQRSAQPPMNHRYQHPGPSVNYYPMDQFGQPIPMVQQQVVVQQQPRGTNHGLHIILSILTGGLWIPVWLVIWAVRGR